MTLIVNQIPAVKAKKTFTKRNLTIKFELIDDRQNGGKMLMGYRLNAPKDGKQSSLRVLLDRNSANTPQVAPGEFWEVEYYESPDLAYAKATPLKRAELKAEYTRKGSALGLRIFVENTGHANGTILMKVFPESRKYSLVIEDTIKEKLTKYGFDCYERECIETYKDALSQINLDEAISEDITDEVLEIIKNMDSEVEDGIPTATVSTLRMIKEINKLASKKINSEESIEIIASEIIDELGILEYNSKNSEFIIRAKSRV